MSSDLKLEQGKTLKFSVSEKVGVDAYFLDWTIYDSRGKLMAQGRMGDSPEGLSACTPAIKQVVSESEGRVRLKTIVHWKGKSFERSDTVHSLLPNLDKKKEVIEGEWLLKWGRGGFGGCATVRVQVTDPAIIEAEEQKAAEAKRKAEERKARAAAAKAAKLKAAKA